MKAMTSASGPTGGFVPEDAKSDHQDGIMIAFLIPPEIGRYLVGLARHRGFPQEAILPADQLHVTLAYFGKKDEQPFGAPDEEVYCEALRRFAQGWSALPASLNGQGRFIDAPDKDCIYLNVDSIDLPRFRQSLIAFLQGEGLDPLTTHGFTPHMTIGYIDKSAPMPFVFREPVSVIFDGLTLCYGDERYDFPFGAPQRGAKAVPYKVVDRDDRYYVQNEETGELTPEGGYATHAEAENYKEALYANVPDASKDDKRKRGMNVNVTDQMNDAAYNAAAASMEAESAGERTTSEESYTNEVDEALDPTEGRIADVAEAIAAPQSEKGAEGHYAYPEESKLPMPDAQHVLLAAAALGPNPPHGNRAQIPSDKLGQVKGRIRARARALGMSKEDIAKVNAYLSGHMPEKMAEKDVDSWGNLFERVLAQTGDDLKAALAAQGAIARRAFIGQKSSVNGLPTRIGGWAMLFTDPDNLDLQGTYFNGLTRTLLEYYPKAPLWMEHGVDRRYGADPVGQRCQAEVYPYGLWLEHDLDTSHPLYVRTATDVQNGKFGYSSDSIVQYAKAGFDPTDGYLSEWPLAGCSLTRKPAEPGLGQVQAKSLEVALKSAVRLREADGQRSGANQQEQIGETMDPETQATATAEKTDFENPSTSVQEVAPSALAALAQMYGCDNTPEAVRSAMDGHIQEMKTSGKVPSDLCKTLSLPEDSQPDAVAEKLNTLYSSAMSEKDDTPEEVPEAAMAARSLNFGALKSHLDNAPTRKGTPFMTGAIAQKGINISKGLPMPGVAELVVDMIRVRNGLGPKHAFNSMKAMTSATGPTGGYVLRQEISDQILDPLRSQPVVFKLGAQQEDMQGYQVKQVPAMQSAPAGNWIGENVAVTQTQPSYRMITLVPHGYQVTVPIPVNVEANMTPRAEKQLREQIVLTETLAIDYASMLGNGGAGSPVGILYTPGVRQMLLATNARIPTFMDIVTANGLLDDSNVPQEGARRGMAFHSKIERAFTGQTDSLGRPLIRDSWADNADPRITGFPYRVSTQIPTNVPVGSSSAASYIFFADWRYLMVGLSDMVELRLSETFMQNLQIGLLAYIYADVKATYPEAFIAMTGVLGADIAGVTVTTNS